MHNTVAKQCFQISATCYRQFFSIEMKWKHGLNEMKFWAERIYCHGVFSSFHPSANVTYWDKQTNKCPKLFFSKSWCNRAQVVVNRLAFLKWPDPCIASILIFLACMNFTVDLFTLWTGWSFGCFEINRLIFLLYVSPQQFTDVPLSQYLQNCNHGSHFCVAYTYTLKLFNSNSSSF